MISNRGRGECDALVRVRVIGDRAAWTARHALCCLGCLPFFRLQGSAQNYSSLSPTIIDITGSC